MLFALSAIASETKENKCSGLLSQQTLNVSVASKWLTFSARSRTGIDISEVEGGERTVAFFRFQLLENDTVVEIHSARVFEDYKRMGLYQIMYNQLLLLYPGIQEIRTGFIGTNEDLLVEALQKGHSHLDAVKNSPFYKVVSKFGFEIDATRTSIGMGTNIVVIKKNFNITAAEYE